MERLSVILHRPFSLDVPVPTQRPKRVFRVVDQAIGYCYATAEAENRAKAPKLILQPSGRTRAAHYRKKAA